MGKENNGLISLHRVSILVSKIRPKTAMSLYNCLHFSILFIIFFSSDTALSLEISPNISLTF